MNNKITFPRLATMLADRSGRSKRFSEDFLREFFALISETLEAREIVKIKGLGTFRLTRVEPRRSVDVTTGEPMEISGHTKVVFIPSKELAESVNAPFEAFTAIEIENDVDIKDLFADEEIDLQDDNSDDEESISIAENYSPNDIEQGFCIKAQGLEPNHQDSSESTPKIIGGESVDEADNANGEPKAKIEEVSCDPIVTSEEEPEIPDELSEFDEDNSSKRNWGKIMLISLLAAVIALFATLAIWYIIADDDFNNFFNKYNMTAFVGKKAVVGSNKDAANTIAHSVEPIVSTDSVSDSLQDSDLDEDVPTAPSDAVVYDTISTTRYLTTMARAHYGNYNLWPYIYQENQSFLGHPDRIRPGTPVVIPKLSKYGVDPANGADIEKAKKLGVEIYARYGKKI